MNVKEIIFSGFPFHIGIRVCGLFLSLSNNSANISILDASLNLLDTTSTNRLNAADTAITDISSNSIQLNTRITTLESSMLTTNQPLTFTDNATFNTPTTFNSNLVNNGYINQV